MRYVLTSLVIAFVTYGQLIIKHRVNRIGPPPFKDVVSLAGWMFSALTDLGILSGLFAAVLAAITWIISVGRYELSSIYPLLAINFLLVPMLAVFLFGESMNLLKGVGLTIVIIGLVIFAKGIGGTG